MTTTITELRPRLHRIDTPLGGRVVSIYAVVGESGTLLFDCGVRGTIVDHVVPALASAGISASSVTTVVISHCDVDHFGGIGDVRRSMAAARILAHDEDRAPMESFDQFLAQRGQGFSEAYGFDESDDVVEWMRENAEAGPLDGTVTEGQVLDLGGIEVVVRHVPGHSPGHTALELPSLDAVLLSDAVLGSSVDLVDGTPAFPPTYRDVEPYLTTIGRLEHEAHSLLLTAHYPTMEGDRAAEFLRRSREFTLALDDVVLEVFESARTPLALVDVIERVNERDWPWPREGTAGALAYPVAGHLEALVSRGLVQRSGSDGRRSLWKRT